MMKNDSEFMKRVREAIRIANRNGFVGTVEALQEFARYSERGARIPTNQIGGKDERFPRDIKVTRCEDRLWR